MNNVHKFMMTTSLVLASIVVNGQTSPITINMRLLPSKMGDTKEVELTITNSSQREVFFSCSDVSMIRMYVYAPSGSLARDTAKGAQLKKDQHKSSASKSVCVSDTLKAGQSVKQDIDVTSLYEMTASGTYHVKGELDILDGSTAKSNQVAIEVR